MNANQIAPAKIVAVTLAARETIFCSDF
jgi:hypothetical protein